MNTEEIRKLLEQGKLVIGMNAARKALEAGDLAKVLVAANAPSGEAESMQGYAEMASVELVTLGVRNDQLGTICRKPFPIAFAGVKK